jgi:alkanesulfonate monooxygenase SsuD/methylene tetrahydromethanopterin reductase-like flavin-dependent oxidoreductase (luciferase family)
VTFSGTFDQITGAGLAPMPVQRPIPVWIGAQSPPAYRRAGRLADGWFPQVPPGPYLDQARQIVTEGAGLKTVDDHLAALATAAEAASTISN